MKYAQPPDTFAKKELICISPPNKRQLVISTRYVHKLLYDAYDNFAAEGKRIGIIG